MINQLGQTQLLPINHKHGIYGLNDYDIRYDWELEDLVAPYYILISNEDSLINELVLAEPHKILLIHQYKIG